MKRLLLTGLLTLAAGCGPSNPEISLRVRATSEVDIASLARLHMVVRTCDSDQLAFNADVPTEDSGSPYEAAVVPGTPFYVWLQGWSACETPCVPEPDALPGDCLCFPGQTPTKQQITAEACSSWLNHQSGGLTVNLSLGPRIQGACPPVTEACDDVR